jgi:GxxExxY protein
LREGLGLKSYSPRRHGETSNYADRGVAHGTGDGAAIDVHRELGPGLLQSAYEECLCHEFHLRNLDFRRQVNVPVLYRGLSLDCGYRLDIIVKDTVILEVKSVEQVLPIHHAQLLTYFRLTKKKVGLLINFNVAILKNGIVRRVL